MPDLSERDQGACVTHTPSEREAIVAWLRDPATVIKLGAEYVVRRKDGQPTTVTQQNRGVAFMYFMDAADAIQRGEHLTTTRKRVS